MITRRQFVLTGSAAGAMALTAATLGPALSATSKGISYGGNKLDVYSPARASGAPVMMFVHGGAWRMGNRGQVGRKPRFFTDAGFVFASVGYSLYPFADVDKQATQVGQAVAFVRANAERWGGDPERIILMGHSAGCHLSCLATLSGMAGGLRGLISNDTGAYDLHYLAEINGGRLPWLYAPPFRKRAKWARWSPISYADAPNSPPIFLPWSGGRNRDRITANYLRALQTAGADVTPWDGTRYSHLTINSAIGKRGDAITAAIMDFVDYAWTQPLCEAPAVRVDGECRVDDIPVGSIEQ